MAQISIYNQFSEAAGQFANASEINLSAIAPPPQSGNDSATIYQDAETFLRAVKKQAAIHEGTMPLVPGQNYN